MKQVETTTYPVTIFIAGDYRTAELVAQSFCDEAGLCVTVTRCRYTYTGGFEDGVSVGLINYPRFPKGHYEIWCLAEALAFQLLRHLGQQSYTIQAPDKTVWFSNRPEDQSPQGERR
jgi:hypothetical protein